MKTLPQADVVIVGGGWTGLLMAQQIGSRTGLSVLVLERGGPRETSEYLATMDELDYAVRVRSMLDLSKETVTFRNHSRQRALPVRQGGPFLVGYGIGGAGEFWGGHCFRILPDCFELFTRTVEKYGAKKLPADHSIQDWGMTFEDIEPYYARAEQLLGVSGKAGNLRGKRVEGGDIFEGRRSIEFPTPPVKMPYIAALFRDSAQKLGYHPFPIPAATPSEPYTNPDGVSRPGCTYCGFCERFGCMIGAKAQPTNTLLPVIEKHKNISIRTGAWVRRVVHDGTDGHQQARGVTYVSGANGVKGAGEEVFQPADVVFLASWALNNTRLLLLSGIGEAYEPATGRGNLGRNLTHQVNSGAATIFMEKPLNGFMGASPSGIAIHDLDADFIDHTGLPFLRGGMIEAIGSGTRPIEHFGAVPQGIKSNWGAEWKKAAVDYYDRASGIGFAGEHLAYKDNYMDLDPIYKDLHGDPLLRMTIDWHDNERRMAEFARVKGIEIARAMAQVKEIVPSRGLEHYNASHYHSTHIQGGAIMGRSPESSVVNTFLQHWQVPNLFLLGASSFPQNPSANPTLTILALTYRTADAIVDRYLKSPGPLAQ